jgi:hypothetical protein
MFRGALILVLALAQGVAAQTADEKVQRMLNQYKSFESFKRAIDERQQYAAQLGKSLAKGQDLENMQRYAEGRCVDGNKVACYVAYCSEDPKVYYSRKCADAMGRAYGDTWMEVRDQRPRERRDNHELIRVRCMNKPNSIAFSGDGPRIECLNAGRCRHNYDSKVGLSGYFSSLNEAATDACGRVN